MTIGLFYRGRLNTIYGPSGDGKTWAALVAIRERIRYGERALLLDWEDAPDGAAARFVALGLEPGELAAVHYRNPASGIGSEWARIALEASKDHAPTLVVIDSVGEAMAASGVDANNDREVAAWMALVKRITRWPSKPAVVLIDHVPKDPERKSAGAIGSQRKLAAITGAAYRSQQVVAFSQHKAGKLKLTVDKDRLGNRARGTVAAEIHFTPIPGGGIDVQVRRSEAQAAAEAGEKFRPTVLMERVSRWLEINPGASGRAICEAVPGKSATVRTALEVLVAEGWVTTSAGDRGAVIHRVGQPFRESEAVLAPSASQRVPPRPDRVPDAVNPPELTASHRVPALHSGTRDAVDGDDEPSASLPSASHDPTDIFSS